MNSAKSLFAASLLAGTGAVNAAAIQTYSVSSKVLSPAIYAALDEDGFPVNYYLNASGSGTGTATLNDAGVLSMTVFDSALIDASVVLGNPPGTTFSSSSKTYAIVFNTTGTYNLNKSGSTTTTTSCINGPLDGVPLGTCMLTALNSPATIYGASSYYSAQSFTLSGGTINVQSYVSGVTFTTAYTLTAVPAPASVWLFGSALLGLAGTRRRRIT